MGLLKSCAEDKVCTIHRIVTFHKTKEEPKPKVAEKSMYAIPVRNKSGRIEINTLLAKQDPGCVVINEVGPQEELETEELRCTTLCTTTMHIELYVCMYIFIACYYELLMLIYMNCNINIC